MAIPIWQYCVVAHYLLIAVATARGIAHSGLNATTLMASELDASENPFKENQDVHVSWDNVALKASLGLVTQKAGSQKVLQKRQDYGPAILIPSCLGCAGQAAGGDTPCEIIQNLFPALASTVDYLKKRSAIDEVANYTYIDQASGQSVQKRAIFKRATWDRPQLAELCHTEGAQYALPEWYSWSYPPSGQLTSRTNTAFGYFDNDFSTSDGCKHWGLVETPAPQVINGQARDYASEHTLEISSVATFLNELYLSGGPSQCTAMNQMLFAGTNPQNWMIFKVMAQYPHQGAIPGFPGIPDYASELALLEAKLNGVKMRIWQRHSPNEQVDFTDTSLDGLDHMEALREIGLVWRYLNDANVAEVLIEEWKRISDVFNDLETNTRPLAATGITAAWTTWMKNQLTNMASDTETWVENAISVIEQNTYATTDYSSIISTQRQSGLLQSSQMKFSRLNDIHR